MPAVLSKMIMRMDYETFAKCAPGIIEAGDVSRVVKVPAGSVRSMVLRSQKGKKPTMSFEDYMVSHGIEGELIYAARVLVHTLPQLDSQISWSNGPIDISETISKISGCDLDVLTCWVYEEECQGFFFPHFATSCRSISTACGSYPEPAGGQEGFPCRPLDHRCFPRRRVRAQNGWWQVQKLPCPLLLVLPSGVSSRKTLRGMQGGQVLQPAMPGV